MSTNTIRIPTMMLATVALSGVLGVVGTVAATATGGQGNGPSICHPVEGAGETGYGWNIIEPNQASHHMDEMGTPDDRSDDVGLHVRKDGRTDVYADQYGGCPKTDVPTDTTTTTGSTPSTTTTVPSSSTTTSTTTTLPTTTTSTTTSPTTSTTSSTTTQPSTTTSSSSTTTTSSTTTRPTPSTSVPATTSAPQTTTASPSTTAMAPSTTTVPPSTPSSRLAHTGSNVWELLALAAGLLGLGALANRMSRKGVHLR